MIRSGRDRLIDNSASSRAGGVLGLHLVAGIGTLGHRLSTDDGVRGVDIFCSAFALRSVNHRSRSLLRRCLILDATMGPQSVWSKTMLACSAARPWLGAAMADFWEGSAKRRGRGRPLEKGTSGNPGGRPKGDAAAAEAKRAEAGGPE
jgi:hypothetical protein